MRPVLLSRTEYAATTVTCQFIETAPIETYLKVLARGAAVEEGDGVGFVQAIGRNPE